MVNINGMLRGIVSVQTVVTLFVMSPSFILIVPTSSFMLVLKIKLSPVPVNLLASNGHAIKRS